MSTTMLVAMFPPGDYHTDKDEDGRLLVYKNAKLAVQEVATTTDGMGNKLIGGFGHRQSPAEINERNRRFWERKS